MPFLFRRSPSGPEIDLSVIVEGDPTALSQAAWAIDPINGDDAASGEPGNPLQTFAELDRRWGTGTIQQDTTVALAADLPEPIVTRARTAPGATVIISGTATTTASGTLTGAVAISDVGQQAQEITQAAFDWTPVLEERIRLTANDAIAWIALVNPSGGGVAEARTSPFSTYDTTAGPSLATPFSPVGTEAWLVETLSSVQGVSIVSQDSTFILQDLHIDGEAFVRNANSFGTFGESVQFVRCRVSSPALEVSGGRIVQSHTDVFTSMLRCNGLQFDAGLATGVGGSINNGSNVRFRNQHLFQGGQLSVNSSEVLALGLAFFDSGPGSAPAFIIGRAASIGIGGVGSTVWGTDNPDVGIRAQSGAMLTYDPAQLPLVTGTVGDFQLGDATVRAYAVDLPLTNRGASFEESFT